MQVFKAFFKILYINKISVIVYLLIFMGLLFSMTNTAGLSGVNEFKDTSFKFTVFNEDEGEVGQYLIDYLSINNKYVDEENDKNVLTDELFFRNLDTVIYIPKDFSTKLSQGDTEKLITELKVPGLRKGVLSANIINQYISTFQTYLKCGLDAKTADKYVKEDLSVSVKVEPLNELLTFGNEQYYYAFIPYISISVILLSAGVALIRFNNSEIHKRNHCSATSLTRMNIEKIFAFLVCVAAFYVLLIGVSMIMYPEYVYSIKGLLSSINVGIFLLIAAAITFLVANLVERKEILNMICNTVGLSLSFLGGIFVPLQELPDSVIKISKFTPTYWYTMAQDSILTITDSQNDFSTIYKYLFIQFLFAVAILAAALVATKIVNQKKL